MNYEIFLAFHIFSFLAFFPISLAIYLACFIILGREDQDRKVVTTTWESSVSIQSPMHLIIFGPRPKNPKPKFCQVWGIPLHENRM